MEEQKENQEKAIIIPKEAPPVVIKWKSPIILMLLIGFTALAIAFIFKIK